MKSFTPKFAGLLWFLVETYAISVYFLNAFIFSDPIDHDLPNPVSPDQLPRVDILVPSFNEPKDMLTITLAAAKNIHYPADKLRVVLCDDGGTDERCNSDDHMIARAVRERR